MPERVVISQSMYFPWVGLLEQVRLADCFIHYDDVQFSRGGFCNRVQLKTSAGIKWLTIPTKDYHLGQLIEEVKIDDSSNWRQSHLRMLEEAFRDAPYRDDAVEVMRSVVDQPLATVGSLARASLLALATYFGLDQQTVFKDSRQLGIEGRSTQRVLDLVLSVGGNTYITGHGAKKYMDHELLEQAGVDVQYMQYQCVPYPQLHGDFTPYVTGLDLIANCGPEGVRNIVSTTVGWKEFTSESH